MTKSPFPHPRDILNIFDVSTILLFWYRCTQDIILHARQEFSSPLSLEIGSSGRINLMPA